jgi:hypothetical protein
LAHVDVVRSLDEVGQYDGHAGTIEMPIRSPCDRIAAIVQARDGRILAVAVRDTDNP